MKSHCIPALCGAAILMLGHCGLAQANPVKANFKSTVSFVDGSLSSLFSVGDEVRGVVRYDSSLATEVMDQGFQKFYSLTGASIEVTVNNLVFTNYAGAPVRMLVRNSSVDFIDITFSTVPLSPGLVPQAPAANEVTDLRFALQDNSGTALSSWLVPDANSAIWGAGVRRMDMTADPNGYGSNGIFNGMPDGSAPSLIYSLAVGVPEPSSWLLMFTAGSALLLLGARRKRHLA